jgi:LysM repeat protein
MAVAALKGPFIHARGYRRGRAYGEASRVAWVVIHTAEGARDERDLGAFFRSTSAGSSNGGAGQDGGYATYVNYGDTPWTNAPLNQESDTIELCGFARWGRAQWLAQPKMLDTCARWIAWRCTVRRIPIRYVASPSRGSSGVTGHVQVNRVWKQSSHWDPGPQFPWDVVIAKAQGYAKVKPPPPAPKPPTVAPGTAYTVRSGDSYWKIAQGAYRDGSKWPGIAKANRNVPLKPGLRITVPRLGAPAKPPPPAPRIDLPNWPGYGYVAKGKRNAYVQKMQAKLRRLGFAAFNPSGATGYYGTETVALVKAFQRNKPALWGTGAKGPDGICGPKTWAAIDAAPTPPAPARAATRSLTAPTLAGLDDDDLRTVASSVADELARRAPRATASKEETDA